MRFNHFLVRIISILLLLSGASHALSDVGKVRQKVGNAERLKVNKDKWESLKVGTKIYQSDFIRTGVEAIVGIQFSDGSSISIGENAEVEMSNLFEQDGKGAFKTRFNILKGFVDFDVKKLIKESTFQFKTGTATASIRGTSGFVGGENGSFYASLQTGKFDIQKDSSDSVVQIVAGETIFGIDSLVKMKLASSGKPFFAKKIKKIFDESKGDIHKVIQEVLNVDKEYQELILKNNYTITSGLSVNICNDEFTIEGSYIATDAKASLVVTIGNIYSSSNLIQITDGKTHPFKLKIPINDVNKLWSETSASITFKSYDIVETKTIGLNVNKSCREVNQMAPIVKFVSYDSINCKMQVSIDKMQEDVGILSYSVDASPLFEEAISKNIRNQYKLTKGIHSYNVSVKDQAGNEGSFEKKLGCFPLKRFNINVYGKKKEQLNIPIPPRDVSDKIIRTLQFKVKTPENDPIYIYKVTVKRNGKVILKEILGQIQSLDYQIPLELTRGMQNKFEIEVVHKSGYVARAEKIYEVQ